MNVRMKNPLEVLNVYQVIQNLQAPIYQSGLPVELLGYVGLRISQMTNCKFGINQAFIRAEGNPVAEERLPQVQDWKTSEERAAIELAEAVTELNDSYNSVSDQLWSKVEEHFNEKEFAALLLLISAMNMFVRLNLATRRLIAD
jgi:alkylhydroperoxidase family enzyme